MKVSASDSRQQLRLRTNTANCNWIVGTAGNHRFKIKTMLPNKQRIWGHYEAISLIIGKMWREPKERDLQIECNSFCPAFWWERRAKSLGCQGPHWKPQLGQGADNSFSSIVRYFANRFIKIKRLQTKSECRLPLKVTSAKVLQRCN